MDVSVDYKDELDINVHDTPSSIEIKILADDKADGSNKRTYIIGNVKITFFSYL